MIFSNPLTYNKSVLRAFLFLSFILSLIKIAFHLKALPLVAAFFLPAFLLSLLSPVRASLLFFLLFPVINSTPYLLKTPFPFNYLAPSLFLLYGVLAGFALRGKLSEPSFSGSHYYRIFLILMWASAFFLFLRWSNITLSLLAFMKDTPVSTAGHRLSFASLFPVLTLALFSAAPFVQLLLREAETSRALRAFLLGAALCAALALLQLFLPGFLLPPGPWQALRRLNGGASDPNGLGLMAGAAFLLSVLHLPSSPVFFSATAAAGLAGVALSASRTGLIFTAIALLIFLLKKEIPFRIKVALLLLLAVTALLLSGNFRHRLNQELESLRAGKINRFLRGRLPMWKAAAAMMARHPVEGVGTGNFIFYRRYLGIGPRFDDLALNQFLQTGAELGAAGLLAFLLFLFSSLREKGTHRPVLAGFLLAFMFGTPLWLPELSLLFWMTAVAPSSGSRGRPLLLLILLLPFVAFNVADFKRLHPAFWHIQRGKLYSYGLYYQEKTPEGIPFRWTKAAAGVFLKSNGVLKFRLFCGYPFSKLPARQQRVRLYWKGRFFREVVFRENRWEEVEIKAGRGTGFLELRVDPVFCPARQRIGREPRTLGVMLSLKTLN